ncbi:MAG: KH domain-containing protein [Nitrososphaerota archaeon]|nr:KH domain-containing protein [Candidatus Calditenuaceae archaeon]MDW8072930.1 KH domain-containing protein [Nitrososphaerota archaeon]
MSHYTRFITQIPVDRIPILIGTGGSTKREIEERLQVSLHINSKEGIVEISPRPEGGGQWDPVNLFKAKDIVEAVGLGFSPDRALALTQDDMVLTVIDLTPYTGKDKEDNARIKARIIGAGGKTRRIIEETAHVYVSIGHDTVAIIGRAADVSAAREAVEMLINGAPHSSVYKFLDSYAQRRKFTSLY